MKKIVFLSLLPIFLSAQFQFLPLKGDYTSYFSTDTTAYVEIYISVYQGNLQYNKIDSTTFKSSFQTMAKIYQDDKLINTFAHNYENTNRDTSRLAQYNQLIDIYKTELPYGEYTVNLKITDKNSSLSGEYLLDLKTIKPKESIFFSDIELSSSITRENDNSIYMKNNLKVVPNPSNTFDILHPMLYYYVEIHNLPFSITEPNYYEFTYWVTNEDGDTLKAAPLKKKQVRSISMAEVGGLNIMALPKAIYFLNISARNLKDNQIIQSRKRFFVYKPETKQDRESAGQLPEITSYYHEMTEEELQDEFARARYIANRQENNIFENLENAQAMRKFLTAFWKTRDEQSGSGYGVYRAQYLARAAYSDEHFGYMGKKGWKSDRGRVYLVYGEPEEYERYPNEMGTLPYVIWQYYQLEGGAQFIFADLVGFGEYQLIHSTFRRELQNPNWMNMISKGDQSSMGAPGF